MTPGVDIASPDTGEVTVPSREDSAVWAQRHRPPYRVEACMTLGTDGKPDGRERYAIVDGQRGHMLGPWKSRAAAECFCQVVQEIYNAGVRAGKESRQ